jgi:DivIVA domain-containing protein
MRQADSGGQAGLAALLSQARFAETRIRPGYRKADVDQFLSEVRARLAGIRQPSLTASDVRAAQFRTVRLRAGYDEEQVDALLDQIEDGLRLAG